jgi:hypothetical protein
MSVSTVVGVDDAPRDVLAVDTFEHPDYIDVFTSKTPRARDRSPEEWGRAILEESPLGRRWARLVWHALGLRLGPSRSPGYIHGWKIADRGDDWIRIETSGWWATGHAVCRVSDDSVTIALLLRYKHPLAPLLWGVVGRGHRMGVPGMLGQAVRS